MMTISRRAFTLLELLIVIAILAIVVAIAVPSFNSLLYSSNQAQAANQLQLALTAARDAAIRSAPGRDAAAVFFFEPGGRTTIVPCVSVGVLRDKDPADPNDPDAFVEREIFVPVTGIEPFQLPKDWMVRAYAPRESLHSTQNGRETGWYDDANGGLSDIYGSLNFGGGAGSANWIFPETGFYGRAAPESGRARQTFMVRFEGGTGRHNVTDTQPVLVVDPSPSVELRQDLSSGHPMSKYRVDRATDLGRFVMSVLSAPAPSIGFGGSTSEVEPLRLRDKQAILGDESADTVLARPLSQVALYNVQRMAGVIGLREVNRETGCLYLPIEDLDDESAKAAWDTSLFGGGSESEVLERIYLWIEDRYFDTAGNDPEDRAPSDARIFGIRRYDGAVIELTGTKVET